MRVRRRMKGTARSVQPISLYYGPVMPIYEYGCDKCGTVIERIQKFSDALLTTCETCGGPLDKLISKSAFHLKGDGWYVTDYARKDNGKDADSAQSEDKKETKADAKKSAAAGEGKSESKKETPKDSAKSSGKNGSKDKSG